MIRLVATDLDGTLWDADMIVPDAHRQAIAQLLDAGVHVLAATSRRPRIAGPALERAGLSLPAVLMDGAVGVDFRTGHRFHQVTFDCAGARAVLACFQEVGLSPCVYVDDPELDVVVSNSPSTCANHLANFRTWVGTADLDETVTTHTVYGFSLMGLPRDRLDLVAKAIGDRYGHVMLYAEPSYGEFGLIVNPPGVTKWNGVRSYCEHYGIADSEILAVGDADNDVPMLTRAGVAVAVSGGTPAALETTQRRVPPPTEGGWAELLSLVL